MKFVQRLEDTKMWKDNLEDIAKGKGNVEGSYYVVNQSGKGMMGGSSSNIGMIPAVETDMIIAKGKIKKRRYKKKVKRIKAHKRKKTRTVKKQKKRRKTRRSTKTRKTRRSKR